MNSEFLVNICFNIWGAYNGEGVGSLSIGRIYRSYNIYIYFCTQLYIYLNNKYIIPWEILYCIHNTPGEECIKWAGILV